VESLLARLRAGDREAAALFVQHYGPMVRRRVRGKLGASMRRLFDSQDILSTVSRRLDRYVSAGRVRAGTEAELWSLVLRMVDAALVDKVRIVKRLQRVEAEDSDFAGLLLGRLKQAETRAGDAVEMELDQAFAALSDPIDRQILSLWLRGHKHPAIAAVVGLSHDAARQRWHSIRQRLKVMIGPPSSARSTE
jgi:DNA-directed RNA polymerase specialized sigma24 family protein